MRLGTITPIAAAGAGGGGGGAAWESVGGDFRAKTTEIAAGDRFSLVSRETDGAAQAAHVLDTDAAFSLGYLLSVRTLTVEKARVTAKGAIHLGIGVGGPLTGVNAAIAADAASTASTEFSTHFCIGSPLSSGATAFLETRQGNHLRLKKPSRPNGVNPGGMQLQLGGTSVQVHNNPGAIGNAQGHMLRFVVSEPDTETAEVALGNDDTTSTVGSSRRGFLTSLSRKYASDLMPGCLVLEDKNGVTWYFWVDTTGTLRFSSTDPRGVDTGGTPV